MGSGNKGQSPTAPLSTGTADISQLNQKTQGNNSAWRAPATLSGSGPLGSLVAKGMEAAKGNSNGKAGMGALSGGSPVQNVLSQGLQSAKSSNKGKAGLGV